MMIQSKDFIIINHNCKCFNENENEHLQVTDGAMGWFCFSQNLLIARVTSKCRKTDSPNINRQKKRQNANAS